MLANHGPVVGFWQQVRPGSPGYNVVGRTICRLLDSEGEVQLGSVGSATARHFGDHASKLAAIARGQSQNELRLIYVSI